MVKRLLLFGLLVTLTPQLGQAQAWSGILSSQRAMDWSGAGATIPTRTTKCNGGVTIQAYTGDGSTINAALDACTNGYVELGAGTFNLSGTGIGIRTQATLRGQGADQTRLNMNSAGTAPYGCNIGGLNRSIQMCAGSGIGYRVDGTNAHTVNWTNGFGQGATSITIASTTGLVAGPLGTGSTIWLDQLDDTVDGFPAAGDIFVCEHGTLATCANNGNGEEWAMGGRGTLEGHTVIACSPACPSSSPTVITISPPLMMPNWRLAKSPVAWWNDGILKNAGLENLAVAINGSTGSSGALTILNCSNCWVSGVKIVVDNSSGCGTPPDTSQKCLPNELYNIFVVNADHLTLRSSYLFGATEQALSQYALGLHVTSNSLIENNIFHHNVAPIVLNSTCFGNVVSYNYVDDSFYVGTGVQEHGVTGMNLFEGNNASSLIADIIHATHHFETLFRNHHDHSAHNQPGFEYQAGLILYTRARFYNLIGNVIGHSTYDTYQTLQANGQTSIYEMGWKGGASTNPVVDDANVSRTVMRWGNWDNVSNTSTDTGPNEPTGTRFVSGEVPSTITNYPNTVPGNTNLPPSFYLSGKPTWWGSPYGTIPYPAIGPDVANGTANTATAPTGGHANKITARLCFENASLDSNYPSSNPRVRNLNAATCYISAATGLPPTPGASGAITSASVSYTTLTLNWTKATDVESAQNLLQYEVRRSTNNDITTLANAEANGTIAQAYTTDIATAAITGLTAGTSYWFNVIVKDTDGNKAAYASRGPDTTLPTTVTQTHFRVRNDDGNETTATFSASEDSGGSVDKLTTKRIRIQVNTGGALPSTAFQLEFKKSTDSTWAIVPTAAAQVITTVTATGAGTWTAPLYVTAVQVECWGGGGGGSRSTANTTGRAGGGGGGFGKRTAMAVTPGTTYNYTVGVGGTGGATPTNGGSTTFTGDSAVQCIGVGATSPAANSSTATSGASGNTGDSTANGGNGANGVTITSGGGGEGGGPNGAGGNASGATAGTGHADAGDGGAGTAATANTTGANGTQPGGGGSGGKRQNSSVNGGNGGAGQLRLTYTPTPPILLTLSANFADGAATTRQLTAQSGTFTAGKMMESTNPATAITVAQSGYSEFEASFQFTAASVIETLYQFRLTAAGVAFDTYNVTAAVTAHTPPPPALSSLSPNNAARSTAPTVTLTGAGFDGASPSIAISGTGVTGSGLSITNATTATATFTVAGGAALGNRNVTFTTTSGTSNAVTFAVTALPTFTSISPTGGKRNQSTHVTLTGTNFDTGNAALNLSCASGVTVQNLTVASATSITADFLVASTATLGFCTVSVTTDGGSSGNQTFLISSGLTLTNLAPISGVQSEINKVLTFTGTGFAVGLAGAAPAVTFNSATGITVASVTVVSDTTLTASINIAADAAATARAVTVTTDEGTSTEKTFTVLTPPVYSGGVASRAHIRH